MASLVRMLKRSWWVVIALAGIILFGLLSPSSWPWLIAGVALYALVLAVGSFARNRAARREESQIRERWVEETGSLKISDIEIVYTCKDGRKAMRWDDIRSIAYSESPYGGFGEDEWIVRGSDHLLIPAYPHLTEPFLEASAMRLNGFDVACLRKARSALPSLAVREPATIECWQRKDPSNPLMQTAGRARPAAD